MLGSFCSAVTRGASPSRADGHAGVDENERLFAVRGRVVPAVCSGFGVDRFGIGRHRHAAAPAAPAHHDPVTAADDLTAAGDDDHDHDDNNHDDAQFGFLQRRYDGSRSSQGQAAHAEDAQEEASGQHLAERDEAGTAGFL